MDNAETWSWVRNSLDALLPADLEAISQGGKVFTPQRIILNHPASTYSTNFYAEARKNVVKFSSHIDLPFFQ